MVTEPIADKLARIVREQANKGREHYGCTLDESPPLDWHEETVRELVDAAAYILRQGRDWKATAFRAGWLAAAEALDRAAEKVEASVAQAPSTVLRLHGESLREAADLLRSGITPP